MTVTGDLFYGTIHATNTSYLVERVAIGDKDVMVRQQYDVLYQLTTLLATDDFNRSR